MRILVFHGYLLDGTGSNVYNAQLAKALVRLGHEVHLLSQERHPERFGFVDAVGDWDRGALSVRSRGDAVAATAAGAASGAWAAGPAATGVRATGASVPRCTLYRPDLGGLLPVYVHDRYEGVEAKAFADCSEAEVDAYLAANVAAVRDVLELARPEAALANHLVMGPVILARALAGAIPYAVKVHGSALEYTVKRDPERFLPHAREGIAAAAGVLTGSRHTAESLWAALGEEWVDEHELVRRTGLGPPGVDVHSFRPRSATEASDGLRCLLATEAPPVDARTPADADAFSRVPGRAAAAMRALDLEGGPLVVYVGKLIVSKGVDLLLAAWPLVLERVPEARLLVVGFGAYEATLEQMVALLADGELAAIRELALAGREREGGPRRRLRYLLAFYDSLDGSERERYLAAAEPLRTRVAFSGRLDHGELAELLPASAALVVPSTFPEAFGMVAAEAAACGALPIGAGHSGLAEVASALAEAVPASVAPLLSFPLGQGAVRAIAERVGDWLTLEEGTREQARGGLVQTVTERWSWEGVARSVIGATAGTVQAPWLRGG
jgi:glycosyltransferase involved in cell wall biosynthesis